MARKFRIIGFDETPDAPARALKIAFATSDQRHVDQHFGSCERLAFYLVTQDDARFDGIAAFEKAAQDGNEDKLAARIDALSGCAAVYCRAIGASAIAQVKRVGVQPFKVQSGSPIGAEIGLLQKALREKSAAWAERALAGPKDPKRFELMDAEGWSE